jgi:hypothetical protein
MKITQQDHNNAFLDMALQDLVAGINSANLGSIEPSVIMASGIALIRNWNINNKGNKIDTQSEVNQWCANHLTFS